MKCKTEASFKVGDEVTHLTVEVGIGIINTIVDGVAYVKWERWKEEVQSPTVNLKKVTKLEKALR